MDMSSIVGGGSLNIKENSLIKSLNIIDRVELRSKVSDKELAFLYKNAIVFIFPSLYEGFGIPVLEAMQCGCPTLLSNNSSLPEVGGDAAVYFDPSKKGDLGDKLEKLILNEGLRLEMRIKGYSQCLKFSWKKTSQEHVVLYKTLMNTFIC